MLFSLCILEARAGGGYILKAEVNRHTTDPLSAQPLNPL